MKPTVLAQAVCLGKGSSQHVHYYSIITIIIVGCVIINIFNITIYWVGHQRWLSWQAVVVAWVLGWDKDQKCVSR